MQGQDGPVLPPLHLYQLKAPLKLNPLLTGHHQGQNLVFNLRSGEVGAMGEDHVARSIEILQHEPATHPRVQQLYLIADRSPWFTFCENKKGVTIGDVINSLARDYRKYISVEEWSQLSVWQQERIRRLSHGEDYARQEAMLQGLYRHDAPPSQDAAMPDRRPLRRSLWLLDSFYVERFEQNERMAAQRLGFVSPDVVVCVMGS